jgi:hypothetical protein
LPKLISEEFEGIRTREQESILIPDKRDYEQLWKCKAAILAALVRNLDGIRLKNMKGGHLGRQD